MLLGYKCAAVVPAMPLLAGWGSASLQVGGHGSNQRGGNVHMSLLATNQSCCRWARDHRGHAFRGHGQQSNRGGYLASMMNESACRAAGFRYWSHHAAKGECRLCDVCTLRPEDGFLSYGEDRTYVSRLLDDIVLSQLPDLNGSYSAQLYGREGRTPPVADLRIVWLPLVSRLRLRPRGASPEGSAAIAATPPEFTTAMKEQLLELYDRREVGGGLHPEAQRRFEQLKAAKAAAGLAAAARYKQGVLRESEEQEVGWAAFHNESWCADRGGTPERPLFWSPYKERNAVWIHKPSFQHVHATGSWVEVVHCRRGELSWKEADFWVYEAPGSGFSLNLGRTTVASSFSMAAWLLTSARLRAGLDSIQIPNRLEYYSPEPRFEIVMLNNHSERTDLLDLQGVKCGRWPYLRDCDAADRERVAYMCDGRLREHSAYTNPAEQCRASKCYLAGERVHC